MQQNQPSAFRDSFSSLSRLIDTFRDSLVLPNQLPTPTPTMMRGLVVAHSIAHMAAIQLNNTAPSHADPNARRKCVAAARAILNIIVSVPLQHFAYINPVMGVRSMLTLNFLWLIYPFTFLQTVWLGACQVLMDEIYAFRMQQRREKERELVMLLTQALGVFSSFAGTCPLLSASLLRLSYWLSNDFPDYQISRIQEAFNGMQSRLQCG